MVRIIKEEEPAKPSTRISTDASAPSLAALRQTEPKKLAALLRGELDWVVMKCLEKQRDRRYETANGLARDLQRYLADELVEARPPSAGYRLRKFARKHRAALASTLAIAVLMVAGLSASLWQMMRAIAAEGQANQNAQQAREEGDAKDAALQAVQQARAQAFAALRSMTEEVVERKFAQGTVLTEDYRAFLRGIIAQFDAFAAIKGDDAESQAVRAEGRFRAGNMRYMLGELKEAEQDYDQALSMYKPLVADFPSRPEFRHELATSHNNRGNLLRDTGRLKEAEKDLDRALSVRKQLAADFPNQPDLRNELAGTYVNLALLQQQQGNWAAAKQLLLEGRPHHLAALKANPRHPFYRQLYRDHLGVLTMVHAGLLEQDDVVRTAETCRDLGWDGPTDAYNAACYLSQCIPIVAKHDKLDDKQRTEAAQFFGDAAMKLLREAVSRGYKDVPHMKKDTDLDPLRQREDFQKLIAELEG
jgi:tetratricopeptide (TPR) repeat protein